MSDELKQAIASFVAACARFAMAGKADREVRRLAVHTAFEQLTDAWETHAP